ncbi:hypothetical protein L596_019130 [Steinernema carpocapsae]|uniref:SLC26A/SulP transporter domain-containing protein n=1 Tax=Steinernema carpocapsae TaxID=34508 RepID=A0A4U5N825_STECR|nr:hypothetical protein L596_019130 [Steinernema carpocapsae]
MVSVLCSCAADPQQPQVVVNKMNRAPMNQNEFDTKFNFVRNRRNRRRSSQKSAEFAHEFSTRYRCSSSVRRLLHAVVPSKPVNSRPERFIVEKISLAGASPRPSPVREWLPIADWLPKYSWKTALSIDCLAGVVLTAHVISQAQSIKNHPFITVIS